MLTLGLTSGGKKTYMDFYHIPLSGTLYVADKEDDDWVGLVFSYQVVVGMSKN